MPETADACHVQFNCTRLEEGDETAKACPSHFLACKHQFQHLLLTRSKPSGGSSRGAAQAQKPCWLLLIGGAARGVKHAGSSLRKQPVVKVMLAPLSCKELTCLLNALNRVRSLAKWETGASLPCWAFGVPPPSSLALPVLPVSLPSVAPACPWSPSPLLQVDTRITVKPLVETIPCVGGVTISLLKVSFAWEACRAYGQFVWCGQTWRHEEAMRSEAGV
eukprot:857834-Pelagomonas_calceolata.AAC.1